MAKEFKDEWNELTQGSKLSKFLFIMNWLFLGFAVLFFISGHWKFGLLFLGVAGGTAFISYRLAGGRQNPIIWKDKSLYDLFKNALESGEAKIGFHSLRDQKSLLTNLASAGIKKSPFKYTRQFLRDKITNNPHAFQICQGNMIIQMIHKGEQLFWDGYGKRREKQYFHEAEIIVDLKTSAYYMFRNVLEGLTD